MYGAVVSKRVGSNNTDQMELLDGDMGGRIIRLTALVNQRIQSDSVCMCTSSSRLISSSQQ